MENLKCIHCGSTDYLTQKKGPHLQAYCAKCGQHILFLPQNNPIERMPFGKLKDIPIKEITDKKYLQFLIDKGYVKNTLKTAIENQIKNLN